MTFDEIEILEYGIGSAGIPVIIPTLLGRHDLDEFTEAAVQQPVILDIPDQALCLVLRQHGDAAQVRVDAIRQREIDDPKAVAKGHDRLRAVTGKSSESGAASTGQHEGESALRQLIDPNAAGRRGIKMECVVRRLRCRIHLASPVFWRARRQTC